MGLFSKRSARAESATPPPRLSELTDVERNWIASLLAIVADAGTEVDDAAQIRALYDDSVMRWHRVNPPERVNPSPMINAIGTALGEHLVRRTALRWTLAVDDGRTELGLAEGRRRCSSIRPSSSRSGGGHSRTASSSSRRWNASPIGSHARAAADEPERGVDPRRQDRIPGQT